MTTITDRVTICTVHTCHRPDLLRLGPSEVFSSNLAQDIRNPLGFSWFSSVPPGKVRDNISISTRPFPSKSQFVLPFDAKLST